MLLRLSSLHRGLLALTLAAVLSPLSAAHFLWLVQEEDGSVHLYFAESPEPGSPALLENIAGAPVHQFFADGTVVQHAVESAEASMISKPLARPGASVFLTRLDYGLLERGDTSFLLRYFSKFMDLSQAPVDVSRRQELDLRPSLDLRSLSVQLRHHGEPVEGAQVLLQAADGTDLEQTSDENGWVRFDRPEHDRVWIRARHVVPTPGTHDGKDYSDVRNYATLTLDLPEQRPADAFPDLPQARTSFGAAICDGWVYVYGGHTGRPHRYSRDDQSGDFLRLNLADPSEWQTLESGPGLQGLAMVAHGGKVYRLGGFTALNAVGEDGDLHSQDGFHRYDPATGRWTELAPMPAPRSSFDAVVIGDLLYVAGGWQIHPDGNVWSDSALVCDLRADSPQWSTLPAPPFRRRALSLAECQGKLYVIGGMREKGGPTKEVSVFDPDHGRWSEAPELQDAGELAGFGSSAFQLGDRLYVTAYDGRLQRLSRDGASWESCGELGDDRFFHRMLPLDHDRLLVLGGANMSSGSYSDLVVLKVPGETVDGPAGD